MEIGNTPVSIDGTDARGRLYKLTREYEKIEEYLEQTGGDINDKILEHLEFLEDNREESIKNLLESIIEIDSDIAGLQSRIDFYGDKLSKKKRHVASLRKVMAYAIDKFGTTKVDEMTIAPKRTKSTDTDLLVHAIEELGEPLNLLDEGVSDGVIDKAIKRIISSHEGTAIEPQHLKISLTIAPDKRAIKANLDKEQPVYGCAIKETLGVRIT